MGIDFSKFSASFKAKFEAAAKDKEITPEEFKSFSKAEQDMLISIFRSDPDAAGDIAVYSEAYQQGDSTVFIRAGQEGAKEGRVTLKGKVTEKYPNASYGYLKEGFVTLYDKKGEVIKDIFGNPVKFKHDNMLKSVSGAENVAGSFEVIENEPAVRTNRRFAVALIQAEYNSIIRDLQNIVLQMGVLDAGLWREALGMGIQVIADLKENQKTITATTKKKIERIEADRDRVCNTLAELIDSPADFEAKFYQLVGKDYRDNAFEELRDIQHNQENKDAETKLKECSARFNELYAGSNITKELESWQNSVEFQQQVDGILNIVVMFVMTGGIGELLQGSVQALAKNILKAAAKGDMKAVMANFAKLAPEVQTVYRSLAKREFGVAAAQVITPVTSSAATMSSWEGLKAFINGATNGEELSGEDLLERTLAGIASGAEMGVMMGAMETFAIAPAMAKLTPFLNNLSGASAKISGMLEKGNGTVSMEKIMETYSKTSETLRGKIAKEGLHAVVALPIFTVGFTASESLLHYDEQEFKKSLLDKAVNDKEREEINNMSSEELRIAFAKEDFMNQVKGMATIEGVGLIFRRLQAGRIAAKSLQTNRTPDIIGANLRQTNKNGKTVYEICSSDGKVIPVKTGNKSVTEFSSIEQATAAYSAMCIELYSKVMNAISEQDPNTVQQAEKSVKHNAADGYTQHSFIDTRPSVLSSPDYSQEAFEILISDLNQKYKNANKMGIDIYPEDAKQKMRELYQRNPKLVMDILNTQLKVGGETVERSFNVSQMENLIELQENYPQIFNKMPIFAANGNIRAKISSANDFIKAYQINPELTERLATSSFARMPDDTKSRFGYKGLLEVVQKYDKYPSLRQAVDAKVYLPDGTEDYAFDYGDIYHDFLDPARDVFKQRTILNSLTTADGKYRLFPGYVTEKMSYLSLDGAIEDLENPEKANDARKILMLFGCEAVTKKRGNVANEALFDSIVQEYLCEKIPDDVYALEFGQMYQQGNYELRITTKEGTNVLRFRYDENSGLIDEISKEEVIKQDEKQTTVRTEFSDGRSIVETVEYTQESLNGSQRKIAIANKRTMYDVEGEPVYEEIIKPSKEAEGNFDATTADRINGVQISSETRITGEEEKGTTPVRKLKSVNGSSTETSTSYKDGSTETSYVIKNPDGKVVLNIQRQNLRIDENNYMSTISTEIDGVKSNQKYNVKFEPDKITVTREGQGNNPPETVTLDRKNIDDGLIDVLKQLPADYLFAMKKMGVEYIRLSYTADNANNAFFMAEGKVGVTISPELMKNPFVFAHELGHGMDYLLCGHLHDDPKLLEIFQKELQAMKENSSDTEGRIIDYFTRQNAESSSNSLAEIIAETNALLSGMKNNSNLVALRGLKLQQNFPETMKYISEKLTDAYNGKIIEVKPEERQAAMRGIVEIPRETITIGEKVVKTTPDVSNELTPEIIEEKGLGEKSWEEKAAEYEAERKIRVAALDKMTFILMSDKCSDMEKIIYSFKPADTAKLQDMKTQIAKSDIPEEEKIYLTTLVENRLNPPTFENYTPEQIAAEAELIVNHFSEYEDSITNEVKKSGLNRNRYFNPRIKSDTSVYDKIYNYLKDKAKKGATLTEAINDVRDGYGMRGDIEKGDFRSIPEVKAKLDYANEEGITPSERRTRLIDAARKAAEFQSEPLLESLKEQIIAQATSEKGLMGVRIMNYVSVDGIPMMSEDQLWDLRQFAIECGVSANHIKLIEIEEYINDEGQPAQRPVVAPFSEKGIGSRKYTSKAQNGYTSFQMNFETKDGDWIEFQSSDEVTRAFANFEHLIYDTMTGKDIVGRYGKTRPIYNQLLQTIDKTNMPPKVLEAYRKTYITDYYTYCRAKSLGIDLGEPRLEDYEKMIGEQLGIPNLKLDRRLDAKNLEALQKTADLVKRHKYDEVEGTIVYNILMDLTPLKRGEASKEFFEEAKREFRKELANYYSEETLENMTEWFNELSQEDLAAKIEMFIHVKKDLPADLPIDKLGWFGLDDIKANNLSDIIKVYDSLNIILPEAEERFVTSAQVEPGAGKAAVELCQKAADKFRIYAGREFTDLIPLTSKEDIERMSEILDLLPNSMNDTTAYNILENISITYEPIKELAEKGADLSTLPIGSISTKSIAENYDIAKEVTDKIGNLNATKTYFIFLRTPESKKSELKNIMLDMNEKGYDTSEIIDRCERQILVWTLETGFYTVTLQEQEENRSMVQYFRSLLTQKKGFTYEEINNCPVEKLIMLANITESKKEKLAKEEREYFLSLNLEKRYNLYFSAPSFIKQKISTCTNSEYENIVNQFKERTLALSSDLSENTVDILLNIPKERYDKIEQIINQSGRHGGERFMAMLLGLSDNGLDNALKRPELFQGDLARTLSYAQRGELFELNDAEYNKVQTPLSERNTEVDINPEEYRAEVRTKLDGSYTLDMSAYEHSRAKKAAMEAKNDDRTKIVFNEKTALQPKPKEKSSELPQTEDLLKKLESKGNVTLSIPIKDSIKPKGNETKGKAPTEAECGEFSTDITLHFGEARAWDNSRFARDMLQNFYDGNGHTLEGVDIKVTKENGRYKVKISGKGIYDYQQVWTMGLNDHNSGDAGKYGEGMKVMFSTLLESRGTTKVTHSSGDWVVELKAEEGKSKSRTLIMGDLQKAEKRQEGASIEFDTTDFELVKEILKAKDYFYTPYNPDFKDMSYENEYFGIKLLPAGQKGNVYLVQRFEVKDKEEGTLDDAIEGMTLVFKVMPDDNAIENNPHNWGKFELETGRNRTPLSQYELTKLVQRYAMTIPDEQLIQIIGSLKDIYLYNGDQPHKSAFILEGFTNAAYIRDLKIDFGHDRYVANSNGVPKDMIKFAQRSGKTIVAEQMGDVGVESIRNYFTKSKKDVMPEANPTEVQANKLKLVDEAVKLFAENLDLKNINIVTRKEASNPRYLYDKPDRNASSTEAAEAIVDGGASYGMWVDKKYFNIPGYDLFEYMATWLHEISHKVDGDGEDPFNARLEKLIELSTQMCKKDPVFRTKLRVLNEEFRTLNKQKTPDLTQELNTEEFKAQMEQNLRWLTEDPELPEAEEHDTRRGISILSNDKSPTTLDYVANQADKYKRKAEAWAERTLSDNPDSWLSKTLDKADKLWNKAAVELGFKPIKVEEIPWTRDLSYKDVVQTKEERTIDKETTGFEYKPQSTPKIPNEAGRTTDNLMVELSYNGKISVEMPSLTDREPKIEDTGFEKEKDRERFKAGKTVRSNTVLRYNSTNAWSLEKIARDLFQNMYDGHRGTLDGIKIDVEQTPEGNYRVKISGQSEYNWFHVENWGASGEENLGDGTRGGGFGEGAKMVPIHLLHEKYVDKYTYASGEWSIDFTREKDENGVEKPVNEGYLMRTPHLNEERVNGNFVEFETSNRDVVEAILNARNYFRHSENPDFINNDVDSQDIAFTVLPKGEKGNFYYNQRFGVKTDKGSTGFENSIEGIRIILKRSLSDEELKDLKITKDNDRNGLDKWDIYKIVYKLAKSMTNEELMDAINKLERFWVYDNIPQYNHIDYTFEQEFAQGLIMAAIGLKYSDTQDLKIVCIDSQNYEPIKAAALQQRGYKIADPNMHFLGFPTINEVYDKATKIEPLKSSKLTIQEQEKIRLLEEAMGVNANDDKEGFQANIVVFDRTEYQNEVTFFTEDLGEGSKIKFPYLAIDRTFLRSNDFMTCYNTLISRLRWAQSDTKARYGYQLTDLLNSQLQQLSLPQNAEKLRLIEERYKKISDL